jgi:hypothetical protein
MLVLVQDIREVSPRGVIVDDVEVAVEPEDVVRLKKIIDLHFELIDKKVISGRFSIGKVVDYAVERDGFTIQKLYVEPTIWNKIKTNRLTIDRSQVIEVSHKYIKIKSNEVKEPKAVTRTMRQAGLSSAASLNASATEE